MIVLYCLLRFTQSFLHHFCDRSISAFDLLSGSFCSTTFLCSCSGTVGSGLTETVDLLLDRESPNFPLFHTWRAPVLPLGPSLNPVLLPLRSLFHLCTLPPHVMTLPACWISNQMSYNTQHCNVNCLLAETL